MYNVTQTFLDTIKKNGREFKATVTIRDTVLDDNNIIDLEMNEDVNPSDSFMLGSVASNSLTLTIKTPSTVLDGAQVKPVISLNTGSTFEDVPLGVFWVDNIEKGKNTVKLSCFDSMIKLEKAYFSDLTYPISINSVAQEICSKAGVELATTLPNISINKIEGYTYREAIGFIASFLGGFARFNRDGKLEITSYVDSSITVTSDNYFSNPTFGEKPFTIGKLTCKVGQTQDSEGNSVDNILTAGSSGTEIQFENPIMTQEQLNNIYNTLKNLSYMPYTMDWQGNHALQAGDKITIVDVDGNAYNTLIMQQKISYKGSISSTASAVGKTEQAQEFSSSGSIKNKVDRMLVEQANIRVLLAKKATIEDLTATNARIDNLSSIYATIANFNATNARIDNLSSVYATITQLNAIQADIDDLTANKANVTDLTAATGRISTLESQTASINNLLAGNLSAVNMQANFITADSGLIANGAIKDAMIDTVSVSKILAGTISTNKFTVQSDSGNLKVQGNTLKVWDTAGKERVSLGLNGTDYNLLVRGADGTTVLFGVDGVTNAGITDGAVDDSKVAANANINGSKIEKESLVTQINGATTTIKGSKVKLDTENQTLDVAFTSLKSTVTSQGNTISSQGTTISIIQGQISSKIWQQDITTAIDPLNDDISTLETNYTSLTQTVDGIEANVSSLQTTTSSLDTRITTAESTITQHANQIALKVDTSTYNTKMSSIDSSISSLESHMSSAELKITDSAIVSTVRSSSAYLGDLSSKEGIITKSSTAPTSPTTNQLWLDTSVTPNILKRWSGSAWMKVTPTTASEVGAYSSSDGTTLANRVTTVESTITQQANQIALKVNTSDFGSLIYQNADSVKIAVGQIGGNNLIKNSRGNFGTSKWICDPSSTLEAYADSDSLKYCGEGNVFRFGTALTTERFAYQTNINLKPNTKYTLSGKYYVGYNCKGIDVYVIGQKDIYTGTEYDYIRLAVSDGTYSNGVWKSFTYTFTTNADENKCFIRLDNNGSNSGTAYAYFGNLKLEEGENATAWSPHPDELNNVNVTINDDGLTVKNGKIQILNNAGTTVISGDVNGNLQISGDFITYENNKKAVEIVHQYVNFYNWDIADQRIGWIGITYATENPALKGLSLRADPDAKYLAFEDKDGNEAIELNYGRNQTSPQPIHMWGDVNFHFYDLCGIASIEKNNQDPSKATTMHNMMLWDNTIDAASSTGNLWLNYWRGGGSSVQVVIGNGMNSGTWGHLSAGSLYITGSKNCIQQTDDYGWLEINAYETAEYYFGDIGSGKLVDGECIVYIDDKFKQCINTAIQYQVFLSKYGQGDIWVSERTPNYFVVKGTNDIEFAWEIKAKRKGYENHRLEQIQFDVEEDRPDSEQAHAISSIKDEDNKYSMWTDTYVGSVFEEIELLEQQALNYIDEIIYPPVEEEIQYI